MAHKKSVLELSNVEACCAYLGVEASDKLVSIIDLDEVGALAPTSSFFLCLFHFAFTPSL